MTPMRISLFCRRAGRTSLPACVGLALISAGLVRAASSAEPISFHVEPADVRLEGNFARTQLLVSRLDGSRSLDRHDDLTHQAVYSSSDPEVVRVDRTGRLLAVGNGRADVAVTFDAKTHTVPVVVTGVADDPPIGFHSHVLPVLSKAGCNMGACHASQHGKGGLKLSVFAFQPREDHAGIVRDRQQRRINFLDPESSLLLKKPTVQVPHGGGRRLEAGSIDYQILAEWIRSGAPAPQSKPAKVTKLIVTPERRVGDVGLKQQLRVEAVYDDRTTRDVTAWAKFDTMDEALLAVEESGLVTALDKGQAPVLVRFEGQAAISTFVIPYADSAQLAGWTSNNFIDELAAAKFRELGIEPSPPCDDATFVRRAFFDAIGTKPTVDETLAFVNSSDPQKREKLVEKLLGLTGDPALDVYNDQYAAWWTLKWSDLIRNESGAVGEQGMWALHNWIKESFRTNKPYDRFVRELVTAKGSIYSSGPANYFRINKSTSDLAESTAQLFLGVRLGCAKCHHHPFEKYSQEDYNSFAAFFSRVGTKGSQEFGLFGRESVVVVRDPGGAKGKPLDGEPVTHPLDLRIPLADWLTAPENEFFARSVVNRYFAYFMGRGLVEPIDDMRETNPPTNVALLDALEKHFVESEFDLKQLVRTIMTSRLYQLDSQPTPANASDRRFYSHFLVKRIGAEALLDAIDRTTAAPTKFKDLPMGTRAIELPDAEYPNYFLSTFGKPKRASVCECERMPDPNLAQALHTLNGDILTEKIADKNGRVANLLESNKPHEEIVDELYLAALCRFPTEPEKAAARSFLEASPSPRECYEDLLWALINSKQFLFVR